MSLALRRASKLKALVEMLSTYQRLTHHKWFVFAYVVFIIAYTVSILWAIKDLVMLIVIGILNKNGASYIIGDSSSLVILPMICAIASVLFVACMTMIIINDANAMRFDGMEEVQRLKLKYGILSEINEYGYTD